jgi:LPS export ABC transporter protein LptC
MEAKVTSGAARLLAVGLVLCGCGPAEEAQTGQRPENLPSQIVENLTLKQTEDGRLTWVLRAERALRYEKEPTQLEGMRIDFYDEAGEIVESVLTAQGGTVHEQTRELLAQGDVVVVTSDSLRLESMELRWDPRSQNITTETPVRITDGENVLTGRGITSDTRLESYVIHSEVQGTLRDEDGGLEPRTD